MHVKDVVTINICFFPGDSLIRKEVVIVRLDSLTKKTKVGFGKFHSPHCRASTPIQNLVDWVCNSEKVSSAW